MTTHSSLQPRSRTPAAPATGGTVRALVLIALLALLGGCTGVQSALAPAGEEAERIARLFWWMAAGATLVWIGVVAFAIYVIRIDRSAHDERQARRLIVGGGVVLPVAVLTLLLGYGLWLMPELRVPTGEPLEYEIEIVGERWWWRVRYLPAAGEPFELANELRLVAGRPTRLRFASADVVHSFWVPSLAGKMDLIPGRQTELWLEPTAPGIYRGACAEYCGTSHAFMAFHVVVSDEATFAEWAARQRGAATTVTGGPEAEGERLFRANGCGSCHTVRGTEANGTLGPDLTHVGSRHALASGILPNDTAAFVGWVRAPERFKPAAVMPHYGMLSDPELAALAAYLEALD